MSASPHFTPEASALVLIDHQVGTTQLIRNITPDTAIRNAVLLGQAALAYGMPIVMTSSQEDKIQGPLHPALQRALPDAYAARVKRPVSSTPGPILTSSKRSRRPVAAS